MFNGRWYLTFSENVDELLQEIGCTTKIRRKVSPLLMATGPTGHVKEFNIDMELKVARRCIYVHDILIQEFVSPLDVTVPYWSFNEKFVMVRIKTDGLCKLTATEHDESYIAEWDSEVTGDTLTTKWTSGSVVCTMTFTKMPA